MANLWKVTTAVFAILFIASVGAQAAGVNPFASLAPKSGADAGQASASNLIPLNVAIAGAGSPGSSAPEFGVAMGLGAFEAQGLDVKWKSMQPTTQLLIAALLNKEVQMMTSGISPFFVAAQKDVSISYFYAAQKFGGSSALFVRNALKDKVKTAKDLAALPGLRCGTGSPGTTSYASLEFHMAQNGFKCESVVNTASSSVAIGSMQSGTIDLVVHNIIWGQDAERQGAGYLVLDTSNPTTYKQLFGDIQIPWTGYLATTEYVKSNPTVMQKYVDALLSAEMFIRTHTPDQVAAVIKRSPDITESPDQIKASLGSVTAFQIANPGYVSEQDWAGTLPFATKFLKMDLSGPAFAYGTFWNGQPVQSSKLFAQ
jgi:ABC-type nitrate/sulfonate/bicarbonate transport system substrate-binding protein